MAAVSDFFSIGSVVWCRTCYNKDIEGEVLAFDPQTKILILSILFTVCPSLLFTYSPKNDLPYIMFAMFLAIHTVKGQFI